MSTREEYIATGDGARLFCRPLGSGAVPAIVPNGFYLADDFQPLAERRAMIFCDMRNRGRSDGVDAPASLARGIHDDVEDLEAVRRHFGFDRIALIGHSYMGLLVGLYAMTHPDRVERLVQIGPMPPDAAASYPARLAYADATTRATFEKLAELRSQPPADPVERCRRFWSVMAAFYVANPADAVKIGWGRCDLPNELDFMKYWMETLLPSIQRLELTPAGFAAVASPALVVHGVKDRSAPYGSGRDWASRWPHARLLTVPDAGHAPWIEAPWVLPAIDAFLGGAWPDAADRIASL